MVGIAVTADAPSGPYGPPQATPVRRPSRIQPHETVDLADEDDELTLRLHLIHAANFNDPAAYPAVSLTRGWR